MSVIVQSFAVRKNAEGEPFIALIVTSGIEMIRSKTSNFYATVRKTSIPSNLDQETASLMIGTQIPGEIIRVPCEPYEFTTADGNTIELDFCYQYSNPSKDA